MEYDTSIPVIGIGSKAKLERAQQKNIEITSFLNSSDLSFLPKLIKLDINHEGKKIFHAEADLMKFVLDNSLNELFVVDVESRKFVLANQTFLNNIGFTQQELQDIYFYDTISEYHSDDESLSSFWTGDLKEIHLQKDFLRKDGSYYPAKMKLEYVNYGHKLIILGMGVDISEKKRDLDLLSKQQQLVRKLEIQTKNRSGFYASLSHEMRTTLNSVQIISQILSENRNQNLQQDQLEYVQTIHNSTSNLLSLLNDVLNISKLESNNAGLSIESFNVDSFGSELVRLFRPVADEKKIRFEFINELDEEFSIRTDALRLEQILKNLISNALKFTSQGFVKLKAYIPKTHPLDHEHDTIIAFDVIDSGIGIAADKKQSIFNSYVQADGNFTEKQYGGTGLGLSISETIAGFLSGKIEVQSEIKNGSTFTLYLPQDSSFILTESNNSFFHEEIENGSFVTPTHTKGKASGRILLIDDNKTHNQALQDYLNFKVEVCHAAETAEEAFKVLENSKVDCIILDYYLPDLNGNEVLKNLKKSDDFKHIPIIIYSGKTLTLQEEKALTELADAIIPKNAMSYKTLVHKIDQLIDAGS